MRLVGLHEQWLQLGPQHGERLTLEHVTITRAALEGRRLSRAVLHDVTWIDCSIRGSRLGASSLQKVRFQDCDLNGAILADCECEDVVFLRSNCHGVELDSSFLHDFVIDGGNASEVSYLRTWLLRAKMSLLDCRKSTFRRAIMEDCDLHGSDLTEGNFSRASIQRTDLTGCVLDRCTWERTRLDTVFMAGAHGTPEEFSAVRMLNVSITGQPNEHLLGSGDEARLNAFLRRAPPN